LRSSLIISKVLLTSPSFADSIFDHLFHIGSCAVSRCADTWTRRARSCDRSRPAPHFRRPTLLALHRRYRQRDLAVSLALEQRVVLILHLRYFAGGIRSFQEVCTVTPHRMSLTGNRITHQEVRISCKKTTSTADILFLLGLQCSPTNGVDTIICSYDIQLERY
jgi:hypothetical protein